MKKLELIFPNRHLDEVGRKLIAAGAKGYSAVELSAATGPRTGEMPTVNWADGQNAYVFVLCEDDALDAIAQAAKPFVQGRGGIAFVSDVTPLFT